MVISTGLAAGPVAELALDLGLRLEFLVPAVALLSMCAGIIAARIAIRRR